MTYLGHVEYEGGVVGDVTRIRLRDNRFYLTIAVRPPFRLFGAGHWRLYGEDGSFIAMASEEMPTQPVDELVTWSDQLWVLTIELPMIVTGPRPSRYPQAIGPDIEETR